MSGTVDGAVGRGASPKGRASVHWPALAGVSGLVLGTAVITGTTFHGGGADMAHHYWVSAWLYDRAIGDPSYGLLGEMARYPRGSHLAAALVGLAAGSPFVGMHVMALASAAALWLAVAGVVLLLPGRRRWLATGVLAAVLVLTSARGPLPLHLHGQEVVSNWFYAQFVAQAVFWGLVFWTARGLVRGDAYSARAMPVAVGALLLTAVHALPAVQLLGLLGLMSGFELVERVRSGARSARTLGAPVLLPTLTAAGVALSPGLRAMSGIAVNDGAIDLPRLATAGQVAVLAALVLAAAMLLLALRTTRRAADARTRGVLLAVSLAAVAVAVLCLVQYVLLLGGEGSPYAVKKYAYGLLTSLAVAVAVTLAVALFVDRVEPAGRRTWSVMAGPALALLAVAMMFSGSGSYQVSEVAGTEAAVRDAADELRAQRPAYLVAVDGVSAPVAYMFSLSPLGAPGPDELGIAVLLGAPLPAEAAGSTLVTSPGSPLDSPACRRGVVGDGLVTVDATCQLAAVDGCSSSNLLGSTSIASGLRFTGLGGPEGDGRWTVGSSATIACDLSDDVAGQSLEISVSAMAFLPAGVDRQRLTVSVGERTATFVATPGEPSGTYGLSVPVPADGQLVLRLGLPDAVSPAAAGVGQDPRELGFLVRSLTIR